MTYRDDSWRDGYDAWKLRSPDDEPGYYGDPYPEGDEIDDEPDFDHYDPVAEAAWDRECRRAMWSDRWDRWDRLVAVVCFWRRWRKPTPIDDDLPF